MKFEIALSCIAETFRDVVDESRTDSKTPDIEERLIVARVTEKLQRRDPPFVAVSEFPYNDGSVKDARADMKVYAPGLDMPIWVEHKPLLHS